MPVSFTNALNFGAEFKSAAFLWLHRQSSRLWTTTMLRVHGIVNKAKHSGINSRSCLSLSGSHQMPLRQRSFRQGSKLSSPYTHSSLLRSPWISHSWWQHGTADGWTGDTRRSNLAAYGRKHHLCPEDLRRLCWLRLLEINQARDLKTFTEGVTANVKYYTQETSWYKNCCFFFFKKCLTIHYILSISFHMHAQN